jgi:predicted dienelactone hydrolase
MRTRTLLFAAATFLALSAIAFAQTGVATFQVGSIPVTTVVQTGNTEKTGDLTFTQLSGTSQPGGTISISYGTGVSITVPSGNITITNTDGYAAAPVTINSLANTPGLLVLNIPAGVVAPASFTVSGVRIKVSGTGVSQVDASISAFANAILAGQTNPRVITNVSAGLGNVTVSPTAGATINAVTGAFVSGNPTTMTVREGFLAAFAPNAGIRITVNQKPPAGVTFTFPGSFSTSAGSQYVIANSDMTTTNAPTTITGSSSSLSTIYYKMQTLGATADTVLENLVFSITSSTTSSLSLPVPLTAGVTATVSLAPVQAAFNSSGGLNSLIPRYDAAESSAVTLFTVTGSSTAMLMPYCTVGGGFDTGIAIANTTEDPGATAMGIPVGAVPQAGALTFYLFPQSSSASNITYTTGATSPGSGLDSSGRLVSGGTYVVLLSQILAAAQAPATFTGYGIVVAAFTNGHGIAVLSNFTTFGQSFLMQILSNRGNTPEILGN